MQRRHIHLVSLFAAALAALLILAGCSAGASASSLQKAAERDLAGIVDAVESGETAEFLGVADGPDLTAYGVSTDALNDALLKHFSYKVGDATVDGDSGTVAVEVTNVDVDKVMESLTSEMSSWTSTSEAQKVYESGGESAITSYMFTRLIEMLSADDAPVASSEGTLVYTYSDGEWKVSMDDAALAGVLFAGADLSGLSL
jgi:hypothetical protein